MAGKNLIYSDDLVVITPSMISLGRKIFAAVAIERVSVFINEELESHDREEIKIKWLHFVLYIIFGFLRINLAEVFSLSSLRTKKPHSHLLFKMSCGEVAVMTHDDPDYLNSLKNHIECAISLSRTSKAAAPPSFP